METKNTSGAPYTVPQISNANKSDWFIFFRFFHAGKWHLIKKREGINRIPVSKRMKEAVGLCEARGMWLKEGWNPVIDSEFKLRRVKTTNGKRELLLNDALDFAFEKKTSSKKQKRSGLS